MKRQEVLDIHQALVRAYGPLPPMGRGNPLDQLIETILSQNTTDKNSRRAYLNLRRKFPSWAAVLKASTAEIADRIRSGGLADIKAPRIQKTLRLIQKREGRLNLARLSRLGDEEAIQYLTSLPGVGVKTANCVLLFSLRRPVMPVDTHVCRVTRRLGWIDRSAPIEKAGAILQKFIPPNLMLEVHVYLVWHGRRVCKAHQPRCPECVIRGHCEFYRRAVDSGARFV